MPAFLSGFRFAFAFNLLALLARLVGLVYDCCSVLKKQQLPHCFTFTRDEYRRRLVRRCFVSLFVLLL